VVEGITARLRKGPKERWDGIWMMLTLQMPANRSRRDGIQAALWFDGFRPLSSSTFIRPEWPKRWAQTVVREHLAQTPGMCLRGKILDGLDAKSVSRLYGLDAFDQGARRLAHWINALKIPRGSPGAAFAMRLRVGGMVAPFVSHDPCLPRALWGRRRGLRDLVRSFRRFEKRIAPPAHRFIEIVETRST
jgi:DNA-binding transcriptional regulator PaaX